MRTGSAERVAPGHPWVIVFVVLLASVAAPLNQFKVPPLIPVLMQAFQLSLSQAGLLMSIFAVTGLVLALPAGLVVQRLGPKAAGLIALGCLAIGSGWGALAGSAGVLLASRVLEGVGMGLIAVVAPASIALWFPREKRGAPMGVWAIWVPLGNVIIYNLAPALARSAGWQAVWWAGAGFALVALLVYWLLMRLPPSSAGDDAPGKAGIVDDAFSTPRAVLADRSIWLLALQFACFNIIVVGFGTFLPSFLSGERGYSLAQAAFIASLMTVAGLASAPPIGWLSDRMGSRRRLLIAIPFLALAGLMTLPFHVTGVRLYVLMILLGLVGAAIPTVIFAAAPEVIRSPRMAGIGLAVVSIGMNLGMIVGPVLFGTLVEAAGWVTAGYWMVPVCLVGFVAASAVRLR